MLCWVSVGPQRSSQTQGKYQNSNLTSAPNLPIITMNTKFVFPMSMQFVCLYISQPQGWTPDSQIGMGGKTTEKYPKERTKPYI